jgi:hypothetical protein
VGVEPGRNQEDIGTEGVDGGAEDFAKGLHVDDVARPRGEGDVEREALRTERAADRAGSAPAPRSGW